MIKAIIDGEEMAFKDETALIEYQTRSDISEPSKEAVRQQRHRNNEKKAATFWKFRLFTGNELGIIESVSDLIVEQQRKIAIKKYREYAEIYPERALPIAR